MVGTRTWGGVIGFDDFRKLVDGTQITIPQLAFSFERLGWGVENYGVDPHARDRLAALRGMVGALKLGGRLVLTSRNWDRDQPDERYEVSRDGRDALVTYAWSGNEVDIAVAGLVKLLEPVMIFILGVVIGGIVIAMYLPMFTLINKIG